MSCQGPLGSAGAPACPAAEDTVPAVRVVLQIPAFGDVTAASGGRRSRDWEGRSLQMEAEAVWYKFLWELRCQHFRGQLSVEIRPD